MYNTRDGRLSCFLWRLATEVSSPNEFSGCCQHWALRKGARNKQLVRWGRRQDVPPTGFGEGESGGWKSGADGQWLDHQCLSTNWRALWLKAKNTQNRLCTTWWHLLLADCIPPHVYHKCSKWKYILFVLSLFDHTSNILQILYLTTLVPRNKTTNKESLD